MGTKGIVASAAGLSILLQEGIGDTIRVSLTPKPGGDRTEEVRVAQQVLQSLGLRSFSPEVTACPGCGRTTSTYFQELARKSRPYLRPDADLARTVSGCGRDAGRRDGLCGERAGRVQARQPGHLAAGHVRRAQGAHCHVDGELRVTLKGDTIVSDFLRILDEYIDVRYGVGVRR